MVALLHLCGARKSQAKAPVAFSQPPSAGQEQPEFSCWGERALAWAALHCGADISFGCNNNRKMRYVLFRGFGAAGC